MLYIYCVNKTLYARLTKTELNEITDTIEKKQIEYLKMNLPKTNIIPALIGITIIFMACNKVFEFSPYEANVKKDNKNTTAKNLQLIKDIQVNSDTFKFAFVTDNHYHFTNLKNIIDDINKILTYPNISNTNKKFYLDLLKKARIQKIENICK